MILEVFQNTIESVNPLINNILIALFILVLGFIIGRIVRKLLEKIFMIINLDTQIKKITNRRQRLSKVIPSAISIIIYAIAIIFALRQLQIAFKYWFWIFVGIIALIIITIFLGIQDLLKNFLAGLTFNKLYNLKKGYKIKINEIEGEIIGLGKDYLKMKTPTEDNLLVPYSFILDNEVVLLTKD